MKFLVDLTLDGDKWCARIGEDLPSGFAGFGPTPQDAMKMLATDIANQKRPDQTFIEAIEQTQSS